MNVRIEPLIVAVELLLAQLVFLCFEKRRRHFALRAAAVLAATALYLMLWSAVLELAPVDMLCYFLLFLYSIGAQYALFEISGWDALYWCTAGMTVQHSVYCVMTLLSAPHTELFFSIPMTVAVNAVFLAVAFLLVTRTHHNGRRSREDAKSLLPISLAVILTTILLNSIRSDHSNGKDPVLGAVASVYALLCCLLSFGLLMGLLERSRLQRELDTVHQLWDADRQHYELSKQNMEVLGIYCHDLKHFMTLLDGVQESREYRRQVAETLELFDSDIKTGNQALDVIMNEKSLYCIKKKISLTCMADGGCLNFMETAELYSIFGNLLSNAIEAVEQIDASEKRMVSLTISQRGKFACIHMENYFAAELRFHDGLPHTTKADNRLHGYGLKSVRLLVGKYHGNMTVEAAGDIFYVNIMIPLPYAVAENAR